MTLYMLDTNTVGHAIRKAPTVLEQITSRPISTLCLSVVTEAELLFGLARRPDAKSLHSAVRAFLNRVEVLPWDRRAATVYGPFRADLQRRGLALGPLDLLIAAHALAAGAILVTNDKAFKRLDSLVVENWV